MWARSYASPRAVLENAGRLHFELLTVVVRGDGAARGGRRGSASRGGRSGSVSRPLYAVAAQFSQRGGGRFVFAFGRRRIDVTTTKLAQNVGKGAFVWRVWGATGRSEPRLEHA